MSDTVEELERNAATFSYCRSVRSTDRKLYRNCSFELETLFKGLFDPSPEHRLPYVEIELVEAHQKSGIAEEREKAAFLLHVLRDCEGMKKWVEECLYDAMKHSVLCFIKTKLEHLMVESTHSSPLTPFNSILRYPLDEELTVLSRKLEVREEDFRYPRDYKQCIDRVYMRLNKRLEEEGEEALYKQAMLASILYIYEGIIEKKGVLQRVYRVCFQERVESESMEFFYLWVQALPVKDQIALIRHCAKEETVQSIR